MRNEDGRVSTALGAGRVALRVASAYPASGTVAVNVDEAPTAEITLRLRIPAWASGSAMVSETPTARTAGHIEIRRVFRAGDCVRVTFPASARATYPDPRIDAARGAFAVERGPLVLVLESVDLPLEWSVDELTADPHSIATDETGATVEVFRRSPALDGWPYYPDPAEKAGEGARVRLIPYHQWANRGPAAMRTWIPVG